MPFRSHAPNLIIADVIMHTMNAHDLSVIALAGKGGRITGAGSDDEMQELSGPETVREDLVQFAR